MTPADTAIHELARGVAIATVEYIAERLRENHDQPALASTLMLSRQGIADVIAEATLGAADDDPTSEVHALRRLMGIGLPSGVIRLDSDGHRPGRAL